MYHSRIYLDPPTSGINTLLFVAFPNRSDAMFTSLLNGFLCTSEGYVGIWVNIECSRAGMCVSLYRVLFNFSTLFFHLHGGKKGGTITCHTNPLM